MSIEIEIEKVTKRNYIEDAQALIEMGAATIDVETVRGLLEEIKSRDSRIDHAFNYISEAMTNKEKSYLFNVALIELADPDPWMDEPLTEEEKQAFEAADSDEECEAW